MAACLLFPGATLRYFVHHCHSYCSVALGNWPSSHTPHVAFLEDYGVPPQTYQSEDGRKPADDTPDRNRETAWPVQHGVHRRDRSLHSTNPPTRYSATVDLLPRSHSGISNLYTPVRRDR